MARPYPALIAFAVLASASAARGQTSLAPEVGVLALRNGYVIQGQVTRAGDYYVVTNGEGSELRLKNDDVESFCATLAETYDLKKRHLSGITARPHLELARWCLRHELYDPCREQLDSAEQCEPGNREAAELSRRLTLALEVPLVVQPPAIQPQTSLASVETTLAGLPKGSIEKFGAIVQPILLNRCGANQCHGPNSKADFRLLRPPPGQIVSRRFTQRNLYATLQYVDRAAPDASPLLIQPQQRHGNSLAPVFDKHSANQLAELVAWTRATVAPASTAASRPATIGSQPATLSQPAVNEPAAERPAAGAATEGHPTSPVNAPPPGSPSAGSPTGSQPPRFAPRDRYDPAIFNERYHAR